MIAAATWADKTLLLSPCAHQSLNMRDIGGCTLTPSGDHWEFRNLELLQTRPNLKC